jgi:MFS transporter, DHA2 family, multidrug resistance protein
MVIFRLLQGAAGAAMIPSSQAILMETFPPEEQAMAMAMWGVGLMAAPVLGPTLGGWITDNWSWRWNFYINLPTGILAAVMVTLFVHDPEYLRKARSTARHIDYLGIVYLVLGLGLLQIVLDRGQRADWFASTWVTVFTLASIASLTLMTFHELRFPEPILDLRILENPLFDAPVIMIMALVLVVYGTNLLNPLFFQDLLGYTAWKAGLAVVPRGLGTLCAMLLVGYLSRGAFDTRWIVGLGFAILAYSVWMMAHWTLDVSMNEVQLPIFISGVGGGFIFPLLSAATLSCVSHERMGYAASLYNMMRNTGSAIGISLVTNLLNSKAQTHQSILSSHFKAYNAWQLDHLPAAPGAPHLNLMGGLASHQLQGFDLIYQQIQRQATLMAYNDIYRMLAGMALIFVPAFLILQRSAAGSRAAAAH